MRLGYIDKQFGQEKNTRFTLGNLHDMTLVSVLVGIRCKELKIPLQSALHLALEIWHSDPPFIRFMYHREIVPVSGRELIPLSEYKEMKETTSSVFSFPSPSRMISPPYRDYRTIVSFFCSHFVHKSSSRRSICCFLWIDYPSFNLSATLTKQSSDHPSPDSRPIVILLLIGRIRSLAFPSGSNYAWWLSYSLSQCQISFRHQPSQHVALSWSSTLLSLSLSRQPHESWFSPSSRQCHI